METRAAKISLCYAVVFDYDWRVFERRALIGLNIGMAMAELLRLSAPRGEVKRHVIFVHGLDGDPQKTWTSPPPPPPDNRLWPTWLAADIDGLAVWSLGYEAPALEWRGSAMALADRAGNVLSLLEVENRLATGDLIFVGHSLGGLVIKQLLRKASDAASRRAEALSLIERTRKVAFLATPHLGADLAGWGERFRALFRPSEAARVLLRNDQHLRDLNVWYRGWASEKEIAHLILYEMKPTSVFGMVVKPDSSDPGLASEAIGIDADHIQIAKPLSTEHHVYKLVRAFIERETERAVTETERKVDEVREQQQLDSVKLDELLVLARQSGALQRATDQGIPETAVRAIVERLGGLGLERDDLIPWLDQWTTDTLRERSMGTNEGEAFERAFQKAQSLFDAGRLDEASSSFMAELARRQESDKRQQLRLVEEAIKFDKLAFNGEAAAAKLRVMAQIVGVGTADAVGSYLFEKAAEFFEIGHRLGDNAALMVSIAAYREALNEITRERVPLEWAKTQNNLGAALLRLGERESGSTRVEEAVAAFREALTEWTQERVPLQWAATHDNLGSALFRLGEHESGTARLEQAVAAYHAALTERTQERVPLEWAMTQQNLGNAFSTLGERESGQEESIRHLEAAVAAYRAALTERTRERVPLKWAMTQNNLGNALKMLGERESRQDESIRRLKEAVAAHHAALTERPRERVPLQWATTQNNLGAALASLGERESRQDEAIRRLVEAVKAYRAALTERTRERVPRDWAMTQFNLAAALSALGERESGRERSIRHLEEAVVAYRAALTEWTNESAPHWHNMAQRNLARCLALLEQRRKS
jgi:tetratricopeptide (TPR) repeat protein